MMISQAQFNRKTRQPLPRSAKVMFAEVTPPHIVREDRAETAKGLYERTCPSVVTLSAPRPADTPANDRSELSQASKVTSLADLTATIVHEVNQPLAAIITNSETALRWLACPEPDVEKIRELARRAIADARRASKIIDRIRATAIRRPPENTSLSLDDVIEESMVFLRHEFLSKNISVSLDLAPALPQIVGDSIQLQQVIVNLVINAVQAMTQSGAVCRNILIRTMLSGPGKVCCTIEDSGPGINPAHLPRLFDRFFTTKGTGMGVGLHISRSIVLAHGGQIRADNDSVLGGARFSLHLPANAASAN